MNRTVMLFLVVCTGCESPYKAADDASDSGLGTATSGDSGSQDDTGDTDGGSSSGGGSTDGGATDGGGDGGATDAGGGDTSGSTEPDYDVRDVLPEDYLALLTETVACDDTWMGVFSADHTIGLRVYMPGILSAADGADHNEVKNLPHESAEVTLEYGGNIPRNWCTDELSDDRVVNGNWVANYGALSMYIEALETADSTPRGHFTLSGLDFDFDGGWVDAYTSPVMDILTAWGG